LRVDKAAVVTSSEENVSNQAGILKSAKYLVFLVLVIKGYGTLRERGVRHGVSTRGLLSRNRYQIKAAEPRGAKLEEILNCGEVIPMLTMLTVSGLFPSLLRTLQKLHALPS
jgi:hypothetical protein